MLRVLRAAFRSGGRGRMSGRAMRAKGEEESGTAEQSAHGLQRPAVDLEQPFDAARQVAFEVVPDGGLSLKGEGGMENGE